MEVNTFKMCLCEPQFTGSAPKSATIPTVDASPKYAGVSPAPTNAKRTGLRSSPNEAVSSKPIDVQLQPLFEASPLPWSGHYAITSRISRVS